MEAELDINETLGLGEGEQEVIDEPKTNEPDLPGEPELSEVEQKAMDQGWSKDRYEEDPSNSRSAKDFVEWGDMMSKISSLTGKVQGMKKSHVEDMANLNIFNKAQTEQRLKSLKSELEKAVEDGDIEKVGKINDEQIAISKQADVEPAQTPAVDETELMDKWYDDNPWFFDKSDPKTGFANGVYNQATNKGLVGSERLAFVNEAVTTQFSSAPKPKINHNRNKASDYSGSGGAPKSRERKLTIDDMPAEALAMRDLYETEEDLIKAFQNSQKGV